MATAYSSLPRPEGAGDCCRFIGPCCLSRRATARAYSLWLWLLICLLATLPPTVHAGTPGAQWITAAGTQGHSVWFRHMFLPSAPIATAWLQLSAPCPTRVFINGFEAGSSVPGGNTGGNTEWQADVSRYMQTDSNVVAIEAYAGANVTPQISAVLYGTCINGRKFAIPTSADWLCAPGTLSTDSMGNPVIDATADMPFTARATYTARWMPAHETDTLAGGAFTPIGQFGMQPTLTALNTPALQDVSRSEATCYFVPACYGLLRITLRNCTPGEVLHAGNLTYICSGLTDEQLFSEFLPQATGAITVTGDHHFNTSQIQQVEMLSIEPRWHQSWQY